jgi:hypothetical protein
MHMLVTQMLSSISLPLRQDLRAFVDSTHWRFAKTYAATWPHEYVVRTEANAPMILALARHIFEHGTEGRFYSQVRKYHHEDGWVYWSVATAPEGATLINRCREDQTYEARLASGSLPPARVQQFASEFVYQRLNVRSGEEP